MNQRKYIKPIVPRPARTLTLLLAAGWLLAATGCGTAPTVSSEVVAEVSQLRFPEEVPYTGDLDIVIVRNGPHIRLINRTPRAYEDKELWLNDQYVRRIPRLNIGTDNYYRLTDFVNQHGEAYPVGTLLQPERGRILNTAEMFDSETGERHRLVVQPNKAY